MLDFSIIIPTKNEEANIGLCLESIFSINYPLNRYEVIVVDNGSNDNTVKIAQSYNTIVLQVPDVNVSALRNHGAKIARGRLLAFIDADCTVSPDWLHRASEYLNKSGIAILGSPPSIPPDSSWVQRTWFMVRGRIDQHGISEVDWLESMNMFIPRNLFLKVHGFNESLVTCEDVDISYRLSKYGKIISDPGLKVMHHGEARTIKEFFKKERWRGRSNWAGLLAHGFRLSELPSLILPVYFVLMPPSFALISAFTATTNNLLTGLLLWQLPVVFVTIFKLKKRRALLSFNFFRLWILYNVYYSARFLAIFL